MSLSRADAIITQLMKGVAAQSEGARNIYREEITRILRRPVNFQRDQMPRLDLLHLVRGCESEEGGLSAFLAVVEVLNRGSRVAAEIGRLLDEWESERQLILLVEQKNIDLASLRFAVAAVTGKAPPDLAAEQIIQGIGWEASIAFGGPALLAVVDLLVHWSKDEDLTRWMHAAAARLGWGTAGLAELRKASVSYLQSLEAAPHVIEHDASSADPELAMKRFIIEETPSVLSRTNIRGGIPPRNEYFTGREAILAQVEATLRAERRASVLPETALYGYGGVGKTQIAVEYTYQHAVEYQLIWWMPAEDPSAVRASLSVLASKLGLPPTGSIEQTVRSVLDALSTTTLAWLLIYDNADEPSALEGLIPSTGGHVLITSRNPDWQASSPALEIDVFSRDESMRMIRKRQPKMSDEDANRLADTLGDLPLALEQAVTWLITLVPSVDEYLRAFEHHLAKVMAEGKPRNYPHTVLTFVAMAIARLRQESPIAAQLLEIMAFLGPEPISTTLLWEGRQADVTEPLKSALQDRNDIARAVRELSRFGLAKVDNRNRRQRIGVHRLVQLVLREELIEDRKEDGLRNARRILAAANPGYPDDNVTWARHAEITPHIRVAGLVHGDQEARVAIMDQMRYVYNTSDYESAKSLAEEILAVWDRPVEEGGHGPGDPLTLLAMNRYADCLRMLGDPRSVDSTKKALDGMLNALGETHEYTFGAVMGYAADLRIAGNFAEARRLDDRNLELHRQVFVDEQGHPSMMRAMNSVAINKRWAGDFDGAYEIDVTAEQHSRSALGEPESWTFFAIEGQARDLLGLGRYAEALALQQSVLPEQIRLLGNDHNSVLKSRILITAAFRKTGRIAEALSLARDNHRHHEIRFGSSHPQTLAAAVTWANTLRVAGDPVQALRFIIAARRGYAEIYSEEHPLTLCAAVNQAIVERTLNYYRDALDRDEQTLSVMSRVLGAKHPFVIALKVNYSNDLARAQRFDEALEMSREAWRDSVEVRGDHHPYTLHAAVNNALDLLQIGETVDGGARFARAVADLERVYPPGHHDTAAALRHTRLECDLEPPLI